MESIAPKKAMIIAYKKKSTEHIEVLFNPNEYALDTNNNYAWKKIPGMAMPIGQFVSGGTTSLTMDIFFDTYEKGTDVREYTNKISGLLDIDVGYPPICRFVWGSIDFTGILEKVNQRFTMFLDSGTPVRATLKVTFRSSLSQKAQLEQIPYQKANRTKDQMLRQGDQLWMIASKEYENPSQWREIANANGIDNPLKLDPGRRITIPRLE
jgi:hypothetical protein